MDGVASFMHREFSKVEGSGIDLSNYEVWVIGRRDAGKPMNRKILVAASLQLLLAACSLQVMFFWPVSAMPVISPDTPSAAPPPITKAATPFLPGPASAPIATLPKHAPAPLVKWEEKLGDILNASGDNTSAARALIAAIPRLTAEAPEQYIAHAVDLLENAGSLRVQTIYFRASAPPAVVEAIFNNSLNRPDEFKLPLMAKRMGTPIHSMTGEARSIPKLYLEFEAEERHTAGPRGNIARFNFSA